MSEQGENGKFAAVMRRGLSVAATLALILAGAAAARAQSASSSTAVQSAKSAAASPASGSAAAKAAANTAAVPAPASGLNTGVQIHGHWKIVVRNPDGTVATRRDFENSLTYSGAFIMQALLGGGASPGAWAIGLGSQLPGDTGPCTGANFSIYNAVDPSPISSGNCFIGETSGVYDSNLACSQITGCSPNLARRQINFQTSVQTASGPVNSTVFSQVVDTSGFEISGTATASSTGTIDAVSTLVMLCPSGGFRFQSTSTTYTVNVASDPTNHDPLSCDSTPAPPASRTLSPQQVVPFGTTSPVGGVFSSAILNGASSTSTPPSAVQVVANQTIQVTVVFTFN